MRGTELDKLLHPVSSIPSYYIEMGVFSIRTKRKEKVKIGITNAELMFIHENGSPLRSLPARPVIQMTLDWANSSGLVNRSVDKALNSYLSSDYNLDKLETELKRMCIQIENYARDLIYSNDGRLAPNTPGVAARKKGNHPLFDTGQLARSLTCRLVKE